jgi:predicted nucleic acid-binding protein
MVTLADTSAWVDFLRGRRTRAATRLAELADEVVTTDVVVMELLMGARDEAHATQLRRMLAAFDNVPITTEEWDTAAAVYRTCRRAGVTVRSVPDCLVVAVARRHDLAVLHNDRDFERIAEHVELRIDR